MTPGEHLIIIGQPEDAVRVRATGLSLRDTLLMYLPGPKALFVYLFRAELEGTVAENVLKHKIGGLNIDACRVGTTKRVPGGISRSSSLFFGVQRMTGLEGGHNPNLGRWPTNLLLVHGPGCERVGERKIPGTPPTPSGWDRRNKTLAELGYRPSAYQKGMPPPPPSRLDAEGLEAVPDWKCQPDCPALLLDEQSGLLHDRGNVNPTTSGGGLFWKDTTSVSAYGTTDAGGAARFYPQFQSLPEALDWLTRLVGMSC